MELLSQVCTCAQGEGGVIIGPLLKRIAVLLRVAVE
jgi:hypothetical protein